MAFVTLKENGEREFTFARKPGADMMLKEEDVKESDIMDSVMIHAGSCSLSAQPVASATVKAMRLAHTSGKLVSFDVNYRNLMWNDDAGACAGAVFDVLKYVDLLKISEEEVDILGGTEAIPQLMRDNEIALVVETLGSDGARAWFGDESTKIPGRKTKDAILQADQVFFVGVGRVMLSLQSICKRLAHLGIRAHYVGEITEPAITEKDLLIVGSGSGASLFPLGIAKKARAAANCRIVHIGSNPNSEMKDIADFMVRIPVRTKLYLEDEIDSCQPMTTLFDQSLLLLGDTLAKMIIEEQSLDMKGLWKYHANLE